MRVSEISQASEARRTASALAAELGLDETDAGRAALVAREAATNLVKHADGGGEILVSPLRDGTATGVQILSVDSGPGIADLDAAMRDGHSTAGSPGTGLGAIQRLSNLFDIVSQPGKGTIVFSQVWDRRYTPRASLQIGAVCEPVAGEAVCGDAWAAHHAGGRTSLIVADGLGHGPGAAEASQAAVQIFLDNPREEPGRLVDMVHGALRSTRGAAVAIAVVDTLAEQLSFAGLGNISGFILSPGATRSLLSHNGTAGHVARKIQEFTYPWKSDAMLLLHSDGLATHWNVESYAGWPGRHPALLAASLYRDHSRKRDDVTVVGASAWRS